MRGWLRQPRFFHNGRVINGPAEGRQRLNHVGENVVPEGRQRMFPVGFAVEAWLKRLALRAIEMALKFAYSACGTISVQGTAISMRSRR